MLTARNRLHFSLNWNSPGTRAKVPLTLMSFIIYYLGWQAARDFRVTLSGGNIFVLRLGDFADNTSLNAVMSGLGGSGELDGFSHYCLGAALRTLLYVRPPSWRCPASCSPPSSPPKSQAQRVHRLCTSR